MDKTAEFESLVTRLRKGDPTAVAEMCERYSPFIRAAVRRHLHPDLRARFDSLDFVQDVWASVLAIRERIVFNSPESFVGFLTRIAHNKVVEAFRQRFTAQKSKISTEVPILQHEHGNGDNLPSRMPTPSQWAIAAEQWEQLLRNVPLGHRRIVERLREGYKNEEIAQMTNVSLSTVNRIVRRLKELIHL